MFLYFGSGNSCGPLLSQANSATITVKNQNFIDSCSANWKFFLKERGYGEVGVEIFGAKKTNDYSRANGQHRAKLYKIAVLYSDPENWWMLCQFI